MNVNAVKRKKIVLIILTLFTLEGFAQSKDVNVYTQRVLNGHYGEEYKLIGQEFPDDLETLSEHFHAIENNILIDGESSKLGRHLMYLDAYGPTQSPVSSEDDKLNEWFEGYKTVKRGHAKVSSLVFEKPKSFPKLKPTGKAALIQEIQEFMGNGNIPGPGTKGMLPDKHSTGYIPSSECKECHSRHYREWNASVKHRAASALPSQAFTTFLDNLSQGADLGDGPAKKFCLNCHVPTAFESATAPSPFSLGTGDVPSKEYSDNELDGVTCHTCHSATGPDKRVDENTGSVGDGIGNRSFISNPTNHMYGNISSSEGDFSGFHEGSASNYVQSSEFCGACHDVRLPTPDTFTRTEHQILENLYTEHDVDYRQQKNGEHKCQACHMSQYPLTVPGVDVFTSVGSLAGSALNGPVRRHTNHSFAGISTSLREHERTGRIFSRNRDDFGYPLSGHERRRLMLRSALEMKILPESQTVTAGASGGPELQLRIGITNVGAGHRVPSGFSHEREIWVWLEVRNDKGELVYRSGYTNPEDDDNLEAELIVLDPNTCERTAEVHGADYNERPEKNLGLVDFRNRFYRLKEGRADNGDGQLDEYDEVTCANMANHINNTNSIAPQEMRVAAYDIPVDPNYKGKYTIEAKMRARPYTPHFLRFLVDSERVLSRTREDNARVMVEEDIKRNIIVDMTEVKGEIPSLTNP